MIRGSGGDPSHASPTAGSGASVVGRPSNVRWLIFALCCATSFTLYLHRYTWGFIKADVQDEFGWNEAELGLLDGVFAVSYGLGQVPAGVLCDWFGPHALLGSMILLWSLAMGAAALAGGMASMYAARVTFGITQAGCYPTLSKVTKLWFPLSVRTSVQAWVATFFGRGGGAMSFVLVGYVLMGQLGLSWRAALAVLTLFGVAFAIVFTLLFRNTPAEHPRANAAEAALITEGNPEVASATRSAVRWSKVLRSRTMRVFCLQQFTAAFADNVYVYWIPMFLLLEKRVDTGSAGWMAALPLVGGAVGGVVGGTLQNHLIARGGNRRWIRSLTGAAGLLAATVFMFVSLAFEAALAIVLVFCLVKFFSDWSQPTVWGAVTDIAGRNAASVFGVVNTSGSFGAFFAGPTMGLLIMGWTVVRTDDSGRLPAISSQRDENAAETHVAYQLLPHGSLTSDEVHGVVSDGAGGSYLFTVLSGGEFEFESGVPAADRPPPLEGRLDRRRGILSIRWDRPTTGSWAKLDYAYTDYSGGWAVVFVVLGLVYLVSSTCWLFIDCTRNLEAEVEPGRVQIPQ
jgi:sugar phosphate permease